MSQLTAEEFADCKFDLPDAGRWSELVVGSVYSLSPPDAMHGTCVLNLSKAMANHTHSSRDGYACYELGLVVSRNPDTVRAPPISYFTGGKRFAESDEVITETRPALIVEMASTLDRRRSISQKLQEYVEWGIHFVWVIHTHERRVELYGPNHKVKHLGVDDTLIAEVHLGRDSVETPILAGFRLAIEDLFAEPSWWMGTHK